MYLCFTLSVSVFYYLLISVVFFFSFGAAVSTNQTSGDLVDVHQGD
jgi:hypothetical protein